MNIPRLSMSSTSARIGLQRTPETLDIENPKGSVLQISTTHPKVKVEGTLPKVQIDQSQCFSESGLMSPLELSRDNSGYALSKLIQGMGLVAEQGTEMTNIHNGGNAIANQAAYNAYDQFIGDYNMGTMPKSRPNIVLIRGELDIKVEEGSVENTTEVRRPVNNYRQGRISAYTAQYNSLNIEVINTSI